MAGFDNALENALREGFGALFSGAALYGLIQITTANAATLNATTIIENPFVLMFTLAAIGYGFFKGRKQDKLEDKVEAALLAKTNEAAIKAAAQA